MKAAHDNKRSFSTLWADICRGADLLPSIAAGLSVLALLQFVTGADLVTILMLAGSLASTAWLVRAAQPRRHRYRSRRRYGHRQPDAGSCPKDRPCSGEKPPDFRELA